MRVTWVVPVLCLVLLGLCATKCLGEERPEAYTLEKSIEEALKNNWSLKAQEEKTEQARYVQKQAQADFLPKLDTQYGYTRLGWRNEFKTDIGTLEAGSLDNYRWQTGLTQPLFTGFALISSYRLAQLGLDQSEMQLELARIDLVLRVKEAYFEILRADKAVDAAEKAVEALASHVEVAQNFYEVGMIPINDLLQSQVELGNARHDLIRARNQAKLARSRFNSVLSRPVNAPVEARDLPPHQYEQLDLQGCLQKALRERPEMKLMDIALRQADQQIRLAKSRHYPEVYLTWDYIKEGDTPMVKGGRWHQAQQWEATAALTWTFWEWGKTYYAVKEQESIKNELLKNKMALQDSIQLEIKDALLGLSEARENIPIARKAVEQGEENLRVSEERYKAQVGTSTEVLDAQRYLTTARFNYFNAVYDYHLAKARLLRAMGTY